MPIFVYLSCTQTYHPPIHKQMWPIGLQRQCKCRTTKQWRHLQRQKVTMGYTLRYVITRYKEYSITWLVPSIHSDIYGTSAASRVTAETTPICRSLVSGRPTGHCWPCTASGMTWLRGTNNCACPWPRPRVDKVIDYEVTPSVLVVLLSSLRSLAEMVATPQWTVPSGWFTMLF